MKCKIYFRISEAQPNFYLYIVEIKDTISREENKINFIYFLSQGAMYLLFTKVKLY